MHGAPALRDHLVALCQKHDSRLSHVKVDEYGVVAYLDEVHAHDANAIAPLVDDLVNLTTVLDQSLGHCHRRDDW